GPGVRTFNVFLEDEYYQVEVEAVGSASATTVSRPMPPAAATPAAPPPPPAAQVAETRKQAVTPTVAEGEKVLAPVPGMIIRYEVEVGDQVREGDTVVILESMKMENTIPAPVDGTVAAINFETGANVGRNAVLAVIT
ncbi:DUF2118 domain-containing protein, partial [Dehalococcoidia bacterium]|nr:DUF2118 domain-containing protein [Dehalococcoidia bacterium]